MTKKEIVVAGGANGVGKTTFAYQYRDEHGIEYLGADEIADQIAQTEGRNEIEAGKEFFRRLEGYLHRNQSVIIESTLSGLGLINRLKRFKAKGYSVHIIYVFLDSPLICKRRIQARVKKGGHDVPSADIERRYWRSLKNFRLDYLPLADTWQLLYNGLKRPVEVAVGESGKTLIVDEDYYRTFQEISK
jgi:predicted ABC-type ATPase